MAHLLIVDDEESICWCLGKLGKELGHTVATAATAENGLEQAALRRPDLIMLDVRLPGMDGLSAMAHFRETAGQAPIVVMTAFGDLDTAVAALRNGAFEYLVKPFDLALAADVIRRALAGSAQPASDSAAAPFRAMGDELLGKSAAMQRVFKQIALAAPTDASVLISGESGTGKELAARAIHRHSHRASSPLVSVNLASLSPTLVESELFGHVRGAFTGAETARRGLLELADGATVFFDEIGDVPLSVQVKLLRAIEQREIMPVGDSRPRTAEFRLIAATHRNLAQAVREGDFREDLFFRLAGFEIAMPPLRDRVEDIPILAEHFLRNCGAPNAGLTREALDELRHRHWPGNVRELRHALEHAAILARGGPIAADLLPRAREPFGAGIADPTSELRAAVRGWAQSQLAAEDSAPAESSKKLYERFLAEAETPLFEAVLEKTRQNRTAAAEMLGIHRATLRKRLGE